MIADLVRWGATPDDVALHCAGQLIYVATPYSKRVVDARGQWCRRRNIGLVIEAAFQVSRLMQLGLCAVSPIVGSGMVCDVLAGLLDVDGPDPMDADAWERINRPLLFAAGAVVVPDLPGWWQSAGVLDEIHQTLRANRRVFIYDNFRAGVV